MFKKIAIIVSTLLLLSGCVGGDDGGYHQKHTGTINAQQGDTIVRHIQKDFKNIKIHSASIKKYSSGLEGVVLSDQGELRALVSMNALEDENIVIDTRDSNGTSIVLEYKIKVGGFIEPYMVKLSTDQINISSNFNIGNGNIILDELYVVDNNGDSVSPSEYEIEVLDNDDIYVLVYDSGVFKVYNNGAVLSRSNNYEIKIKNLEDGSVRNEMVRINFSNTISPIELSENTITSVSVESEGSVDIYIEPIANSGETFLTTLDVTQSKHKSGIQMLNDNHFKYTAPRVESNDSDHFYVYIDSNEVAGRHRFIRVNIDIKSKVQPFSVSSVNLSTKEDTTVSSKLRISDPENAGSYLFTYNESEVRGKLSFVGQDIIYSPEKDWHGNSSTIISVRDQNYNRTTEFELNLSVESVVDRLTFGKYLTSKDGTANNDVVFNVLRGSVFSHQFDLDDPEFEAATYKYSLSGFNGDIKGDGTSAGDSITITDGGLITYDSKLSGTKDEVTLKVSVYDSNPVQFRTASNTVKIKIYESDQGVVDYDNFTGYEENITVRSGIPSDDLFAPFAAQKEAHHSYDIKIFPANGSLIMQKEGASTLGYYKYVSERLGTDTFFLEVTDNIVGSSMTIKYNVTVLPAVEDFDIEKIHRYIETTMSEPHEMDISMIDVNNHGINILTSEIVQPVNGSVSKTLMNGRLKYTPNANFLGEDQFTVVVRSDDNEYVKTIVFHTLVTKLPKKINFKRPLEIEVYHRAEKKVIISDHLRNDDNLKFLMSMGNCWNPDSDGVERNCKLFFNAGKNTGDLIVDLERVGDDWEVSVFVGSGWPRENRGKIDVPLTVVDKESKYEVSQVEFSVSVIGYMDIIHDQSELMEKFKKRMSDNYFLCPGVYNWAPEDTYTYTDGSRLHGINNQISKDNESNFLRNCTVKEGETIFSLSGASKFYIRDGTVIDGIVFDITNVDFAMYHTGNTYIENKYDENGLETEMFGATKQDLDPMTGDYYYTINYWRDPDHPLYDYYMVDINRLDELEVSNTTFNAAPTNIGGGAIFSVKDNMAQSIIIKNNEFRALPDVNGENLHMVAIDINGIETRGTSDKIALDISGNKFSNMSHGILIGKIKKSDGADRSINIKLNNNSFENIDTPLIINDIGDKMPGSAFVEINNNKIEGAINGISIKSIGLNRLSRVDGDELHIDIKNNDISSYINPIEINSLVSGNLDYVNLRIENNNINVRSGAGIQVNDSMIFGRDVSGEEVYSTVVINENKIEKIPSHALNIADAVQLSLRYYDDASDIEISDSLSHYYGTNKVLYTNFTDNIVGSNESQDLLKSGLKFNKKSKAAFQITKPHGSDAGYKIKANITGNTSYAEKDIYIKYGVDAEFEVDNYALSDEEFSLNINNNTLNTKDNPFVNNPARYSFIFSGSGNEVCASIRGNRLYVLDRTFMGASTVTLPIMGYTTAVDALRAQNSGINGANFSVTEDTNSDTIVYYDGSRDRCF